MLKLKKLQQQQQQKRAEQSGEAPSTASPSADQTPGATTEQGGEASSSTGYVLKKQNSKELLQSRRSKSKENLFSLRNKRGGGARKKKTDAAELRAHKDVTEMDEIPGVVVDFPDPNNLMTFHASVTPADGLYKGATFRFVINIPRTYPYEPPKVECQTLVYHPNIDWEGHVCLNILRADWMPVLNLGSVLFGLMTLFLEPNPDDPLNKEAAQLMIERPQEFDRNVKQTLRGGYVMGRQFPKLV